MVFFHKEIIGTSRSAINLHFRNIEEMNGKVIECQRCARLVKFRVDVATRNNRYKNEEYWSKPVPGFGDINGNLLILGLAPAATGANRTGRIFTGDKSSDFLVSCLYEAGITNLDHSISRDDGLVYRRAYITAVLKCVPPMDKPLREELLHCSEYLRFEIESMKNLKAILTLGRVAHDAVLRYFRTLGIETSGYKFQNGAEFDIAGKRIFCSYHPSPRNVNTHRITRDGFILLLKRLQDYIRTS